MFFELEELKYTLETDYMQHWKRKYHITSVTKIKNPNQVSQKRPVSLKWRKITKSFDKIIEVHKLNKF